MSADNYALIAELSARVAARRPAAEADAWEFAAEEYEVVTGTPLDRANAYHVALAGAVVGSGEVWSLLRQTSD